jgi:hypothetical protein
MDLTVAQLLFESLAHETKFFLKSREFLCVKGHSRQPSEHGFTRNIYHWYIHTKHLPLIQGLLVGWSGVRGEGREDSLVSSHGLK